MNLEPIILALITGLPPTIAAIAALIVSVRNSHKADEIHILVNSNLAKVKAELEDVKAKLTALQDEA